MATASLKYCILLAIVIGMPALALVAQQPQSKVKRSYESRPDKVEILLDSAELNFDSDLPEAFDYVEEALEISIKENNKAGEARSYRMLGKTNFNLEQYDLAADYYQKSMQYAVYLSASEISSIYHELALSKEKQNQLQEALNDLFQAISYAKEAADIQQEINIRYDLARLLVRLNQSEEALEEYNTIRKLEEERNNQRGLVMANTLQGEVYLQQNKPEQAISRYKEAERIADEAQDVDLKSDALRKQGKAYRQSRRYEEELQVRQRSLELAEESAEPDEAAEDNLQIGEIYLETEQPQRAEEYIQRSIALSEQTGNIEKKGVALKKLSEAYDRQGAYGKALSSYKEYAETMDSVYQRRERKLQENLELVASVSRKLQRIDLLEQDYEITKKTLALLEKEQQVNANALKTQKWISYGLVFLALGLGLSTFFVYRSAVQKRRANLLLALRSLRSQMNPHFIFNSLNSVNSYIASSDERMANKYLSDFSKLMRQVLENSKHDFVPLRSELEVIELYIKLEHSRFSEKFDYSFEIDDKVKKADFDLPPMLIQPYIENAVWHGLRYKDAKGFLEVKMFIENKLLIVSISDNGIGRKKSKELKTKHQQKNSATGMRNTESRLKIINTVYKMHFGVEIEDLDKENETGTKVILRIPLKNNVPE